MSGELGTTRTKAMLGRMLKMVLVSGLFCGLLWAIWPQTTRARATVRLIQQQPMPLEDEAAGESLTYTQQLTDILAANQPEPDADMRFHLRQSPIAGVFWLDVEGRGDSERLAVAAGKWRTESIAAISTARAHALGDVPDARRARVAQRMFSAQASGEVTETPLEPPWTALLVFGLVVLFSWTRWERHG